MTSINKLPLILDGATGTELQKNGLPLGVCTEKWILENPQAIIDLQKAYVEAGSDAVYAATFGANSAGFKKHGLEGSVSDYIFRLVELSKKAVDGKALVGGDMAPCGLQLPPMGTSSFQELIDIFSQQARALNDAGADFIGIETQMSLAEARATVMAAKASTDKPVFVSFTCTDNGYTLYGGDLISALVSLQELGISAFGINCSGNLKLVEELTARMAKYARVPLIVKPNAGMPAMKDGKTVYNMSAQELAASVSGLTEAGARIFGGCCGTAPGHIAAIKNALDGLDFPPVVACDAVVYASEREFIEYSPDTVIEDITLSDNIIEDAAVAQAMGADILRVRLHSERDIEIIEDNQYAIKAPLCFSREDGELFDKAVRIYHGKPMII